MLQDSNQGLENMSKAEICSLKMKAIIMWKEYFREMKTKYSLAYSIMSPDEQKEVVRTLADIYLQYKYNPKIADEEEMIIYYPFYKYTDNKNEINLISLSLNDVFRL